jgi:hypothetical protein
MLGTREEVQLINGFSEHLQLITTNILHKVLRLGL